MAKKKSKDEIEASTEKFTETVSAISKFLQHITTLTGIVFCVYFIMDAIKVFAGTNSNANIFFSLLADFKINEWFGYIFGGGGLTYGVFQRQRLKRLIKQKSERIDKLEKTLDSDKQSSGIRTTGDTNYDY